MFLNTVCYFLCCFLYIVVISFNWTLLNYVLCMWLLNWQAWLKHSISLYWKAFLPVIYPVIVFSKIKLSIFLEQKYSNYCCCWAVVMLLYRTSQCVSGRCGRWTVYCHFDVDGNSHKFTLQRFPVICWRYDSFVLYLFIAVEFS